MERLISRRRLALLLGSGGLAAVALAGGARAASTPPPQGLRVTGTIIEPASGKGWHKSAVTVHWTCTDDAGTVAPGACPTDQVDAADGTHEVHSADVVDDHGNHAVGAVTVKADHDAPETDATYSLPVYTNPATGTQWYGKGGPNVTVATNDDDIVAPLTLGSGVTASYLELDGGAERKRMRGSVDDTSGTTTASGTHMVRAYSEDEAGNVEAESGKPSRRPRAVNMDEDDPYVAGTPSSLPNAYGWYNTDVSLTYACGDATTGVKTCPAPYTQTTEGYDNVATAAAYDNTSNVAYDVEHLNVDKTGPSVNAGPGNNEPPNANGWYNHDLVIHTDCADGLSGVDQCDADELVTGDGPHSGSHRGQDKAGNSGSSAYAVKIDKTAPGVTINGVVDGSTSVLGGPTATPSCTASDFGSGLTAACTGALSGGAVNGVGNFTYTARATDLAGNSSTKTVHFNVVYRFDGFNSPGNNSQQSAGRPITVTFTPKNAAGRAVQTASAPVWMTPLKGSSLTLKTATFPAGTQGDGGTFSFDAKKGAYSFTWNTTTAMAGSWWQIGVRLDDGTTHTIVVGLK